MQHMSPLIAGPVLIPLLFLQQTGSKPPEKGAIEGQVRNALTGELLRKAQVVLRSTGGREWVATTDAGGRFALTGIEPGRYKLRAERSGYSPLEYGARSPDRPGTVLTVGTGQKLADIDLRLVPHSAILGRIVDEDREPLPQVQVYCFKSGGIGGRQLSLVWGGVTNDAGEFRVNALIPGKYVLAALYSPARRTGEGGAAERAGEESYAPTFYPGTNEAAQAIPIEVGPGQEVRGIEFAPVRRLAVRVRGRVPKVFQAEAGTMITLSPREAGNASFLDTKVTTVRDPAGSFELRGVAPGSYILRAESSDESRRYTARQPIEVGESDLDGVTLVPAPGVVISGQLTADGAGTIEFEKLRVTLRPRESPLDLASAAVRADGSFTLKDVARDVYVVTVAGIPEAAYVKAIRVGTEDVMNSGLNVEESGAGARLEILLSASGGQIDGTVIDGRQNLRWATVVLVPEPGRRAQPYWYKESSTDQYGHFLLRGIAPGNYTLFAWEDIESGAYQDAQVLKRFEDRGESVNVSESDRQTRRLRLIETDGQRAAQD